MWMILSRGTIAAIQNVGYEIFNLGGGRNPISLNTIIEKLETLIGKKAIIDLKPFHIADLMETWADIDKAKNLLIGNRKVSMMKDWKSLFLGTLIIRNG